MSDKRTLEFNALPEQCRRRFVASINQTGEPKPLYFNEAPTAAGGLRGMLFACELAVS
ncbi:hypothetical protein [Enhygromyxa salina]|uniref:Uncharacterized protein n=1 Tax=Enhygromyxa salina TaxID=215803 RepID=A0A2S9YFN1_9BACT|nr:hypothetical protein [Enhygromyxa salina]PRQ03905.1 hypothetical protein ENSA7_51960 [Enhygromyxa salina]